MVDAFADGLVPKYTAREDSARIPSEKVVYSIYIPPVPAERICLCDAIERWTPPFHSGKPSRDADYTRNVEEEHQDQIIDKPEGERCDGSGNALLKGKLGQPA